VAYVHVPFCRHRCGYCDFATVAGADHLQERYLDALEREIRERLPGPQRVEAIFIGGGTPTRLSLGRLERLIAMCARWFPLVAGGEWTVESNPGTLDGAKAALLSSGGVTRVSIGAQTFHGPSLRVLEREHDPVEVAEAAALARERFSSWSLDLIFGVPGSSLGDWERDLEAAFALGPPHLSSYNLIFEKGTPLWKQRAAGLVRPMDEEIEFQMYEHLIMRAGSAGLEQYEISNFARPGHACRHNRAYWANEAYFGFGLGAARYVRGERAVNTRDLMAYLERIEAGLDPTGPRERLDSEARARETAVLMLRRLDAGLNRAEFAERTGFTVEELAAEAVARHVRRGYLREDGGTLRLTRQGLFVSDSVLADFL
jgi:oxygen-independent coproporphyrinogen-3 oxidase